MSEPKLNLGMAQKNIAILILLLQLFMVGDSLGKESEYQIIKSEKSDKKVYMGIFYVNRIFSTIVKSPNVGATPIKTVECGDSVKVFESSLLSSRDWYYVEKGKIEGLIKKEDISLQKEQCFKDKYPKFYGELILDDVSRYYWGTLFERYVKGETKVKLR